jgi:hypothetical protein
VNHLPSMFVIMFEKAPFAKVALFAMVNQNNKSAPYIGVLILHQPCTHVSSIVL